MGVARIVTGIILTIMFSASGIGKRADPVADRIERLLARMTLEEKIDMLGGVDDFFIRAVPRLGIPAIKMSDGPLGVRTWGPATAFPAGIAFAAAWDPMLVEAYGAAAGREARARGVHMLLSPGLNIYRAPMAGRNFEYYGEDPFLAGRLAAAYVRGVQSQGVVATAKHFAGNNQEYERYLVSSDMDERTLQEIYLPAFRAAVVEGGAGAVMTAYNPLNGTNCSENRHLLHDILKGQWGFGGLVMSDWGACRDGGAAANAGLDLEMPSGEHLNRETLIPAVRAGKVKMAAIDDKIRRLLGVVARADFLDRPQEMTHLPLYDPDSRLLALRAARESAVLLKNEGKLLPLNLEQIKTIAVIGPDAHPAVTGGGGSSRVAPFRAVSVLEGITQIAGEKIRILYDHGYEIRGEPYFAGAAFFTYDRENPQQEVPGLTGEYFSNLELAGIPAQVRVDEHVDYVWREPPAPGLQLERFSARWMGFMKPTVSGNHHFVVSGDDGYRLWVDGKLVLDEWRKEWLANTRWTAVLLEAGRNYAVKLECFQDGGDAVARLGWMPPVPTLIGEALKIAAAADVAVVCAGFNAELEREDRDRSFALPVGQAELIAEIARVNPRTVVVLFAGGHVDPAGWLERTPALLHAWYPGQEGGTAVAEILLGRINPSGRLPISCEKKWEDNAVFASYADDDQDGHVFYREGIFLGYRHFDRSGVEPLFPFGHGLSYTNFEYGNLRVTPVGDGSIIVRVDVKNTGAVRGAEVAQVYLKDVACSEPRPEKELKGFAKITLDPGETKEAVIELKREVFSFFSAVREKWLVEPGEFVIMVGASSRDIRLSKQLSIK